MLIGIVKRPNTSDATVCRYISALVDCIVARGHIAVIPDDPDMISFMREFYLKSHPESLRVMSYPTMQATCNLAIVVGGDGTMIQALKHLYGLPVLGVNMGYLGFITDVPLAYHVTDVLDMVETNQMHVETRTMLCAVVEGQTDPVFALNDIVLSRKGGRIVTFNVHIDGEFAYKARGDGVMISTPTGSTAYAMAAGGAIVAPTARVFEVVPMLPQTLSHRPLILNDDVVISVSVASGQVEMFADGMTSAVIPEDGTSDTVNIYKAAQVALILHPNSPTLQYSYFNTLRTKLNWQYVPGTAS